MNDAKRFYRAIWDLREGRISADGYRAIMRELRSKLGDTEFEALKVRVIAADIPQLRAGRYRAMTDTIVAYAVHIEGSLWDDPDISAWCESIYDAASMMDRAEAFFADDPESFPNLMTIVRAEFTRDEWNQVVENGWAR